LAVVCPQRVGDFHYDLQLLSVDEGEP